MAQSNVASACENHRLTVNVYYTRTPSTHQTGGAVRKRVERCKSKTDIIFRTIDNRTELYYYNIKLFQARRRRKSTKVIWAVDEITAVTCAMLGGPAHV